MSELRPAPVDRLSIFIEELKPILARNYAALGFELISLKTCKYPHDWKQYIQGQIRCPCGGIEHFSFMLTDEELVFTKANLAEQMAIRILTQSASKEHLEQDVKDGTLPPFDIDKHCFKGILV